MDELEDQISELKAANKKLLEENTRLKEGQQCPNCKSCSDIASGAPSVISASVKSESTSKSAVLSPQQKEQVQILLALITTLCSLMLRKSYR